jgi:hypothetical protein
VVAAALVAFVMAAKVTEVVARWGLDHPFGVIESDDPEGVVFGRHDA